MPYQITEDRTGATGYRPRGAALALWKCRDHEVLLAGPAETGKTYACLQKLDALLWKYPRAQALMARKTYKSLCESALRSYTLKILGKDSPVRPYGGDRPHWFDYPQGSRLTLAGLDDAGKVLSAEYDFVYVNQAEEIEVADWETLLTRATGRAGNVPYPQALGDCNPGPPTHWIKHRPTLRVFESRHEDNPTLYDDGGTLTEQGQRTLATLDALTGLRKERLRHGRWVQAEGVVYEGWDARRHLIDRFPIPRDWPRLWSVDFGYTHPFVWQAWARDPDGRLFRYREIYHTSRLVKDHAARIRELTRDEPDPEVIVCDHDAEGRATLAAELGRSTRPAVKVAAGMKLPGIQETAARLRAAGDGRARLYLLRDSLDERDPRLAEARKPCCTEEEFEWYVWDTRRGLRTGDVPVKEHDHGLDALRYLVYYAETGGPWEVSHSDPRESAYQRTPKEASLHSFQAASSYDDPAAEDDPEAGFPSWPQRL